MVVGVVEDVEGRFDGRSGRCWSDLDMENWVFGERVSHLATCTWCLVVGSRGSALSLEQHVYMFGGPRWSREEELGMSLWIVGCRVVDIILDCKAFPIHEDKM